METIYVKILNEDFDVWRPIKVSKTNRLGIWLIEPPPINIVPDNEEWEFKPGMLVTLKKINSDGEIISVADKQIL